MFICGVRRTDRQVWHQPLHDINLTVAYTMHAHVSGFTRSALIFLRQNTHAGSPYDRKFYTERPKEPRVKLEGPPLASSRESMTGGRGDFTPLYFFILHVFWIQCDEQIRVIEARRVVTRKN